MNHSPAKFVQTYVVTQQEIQEPEQLCPSVLYGLYHKITSPSSWRKTSATFHLFVKWSDVLCESSVLRLAKCYCPNRNCSADFGRECGGGNAKRSRCPNCKRLFCFKCKLPWHAGLRCDGKDINDVAFHVLAMRVTAISITNAEDELIITFVIVNLGTNYGHVAESIYVSMSVLIIRYMYQCIDLCDDEACHGEEMLRRKTFTLSKKDGMTVVKRAFSTRRMTLIQLPLHSIDSAHKFFFHFPFLSCRKRGPRILDLFLMGKMAKWQEGSGIDEEEG
ncbi:hypothetical protein HAX54_021285 [Datura stramonium]|uniref:IBR domain-containing protein n=1 Tax=Datura stramonium TaxID=4076 RepID=A0ABS8S388_DATST|nr:hypothetical protein [Datura stramonium]